MECRNSLQIRPVRAEDAFQIAEIYNYYVLNSEISFEEEAVSVEEMANRIGQKTKKFPWLVCEEKGELLGYAYLDRWKERSAYRHTAEDTIYVRHGETGKGIGSKLIGALMEEGRRDAGIHALMAVIALPNEGSIRLHEMRGFVKSAHFREVGYKHGKWIDVGYWEKIIGKMEIS